MTLKEKLAKAKLINTYTLERDFYANALKTGKDAYAEFYTRKINAFQSKIDELEEAKPQ